MANTTSAKKATRKIARRTIVNKSRRTQMRGAVRTVEEAIKSGDRNAALEAIATPSTRKTFNVRAIRCNRLTPGPPLWSVPSSEATRR